MDTQHGTPTQRWIEDNTDRMPTWVCWPWKGDKRDAGVARRAAYEAHTGPVMSGVRLQVRCKGAYCINPAHAVPVPFLGSGDIGRLREVLQRALEPFAHLPHLRMTATALKALAGLSPLEKRTAFRQAAKWLGFTSKHMRYGEVYYRGDWEKAKCR